MPTMTTTITRQENIVILVMIFGIVQYEWMSQSYLSCSTSNVNRDSRPDSCNLGRLLKLFEHFCVT